MQTKLVERGWIDLGTAPREGCKVNHLTDAADPRWTGTVDLGPSASYTLDAGWHHDLYVIMGQANVEGDSLEAEDFLTRCGGAVVHAGEDGARLLLYRETSNSRYEPMIRSARERVWHLGLNPRMRVVPLAGDGQRVSLIAWQTGARTRDHTHPSGEEIFVLSGELRDIGERYPSGTWLRLHPGARHAPFAETPTIILLRRNLLHAA